MQVRSSANFAFIQISSHNLLILSDYFTKKMSEVLKSECHDRSSSADTSSFIILFRSSNALLYLFPGAKVAGRRLTGGQAARATRQRLTTEC